MDFRKNIESTYSEDGGQQYHHDTHNLLAGAFELIAENRRRKLQPHIHEDAKVFEFGVGQGWNLAFVKAADRLGYDLSAVEETLARYGIRFTSDLENLPRPGFEIIVCSHVLEHVAAPAEILSTIYDLLLPQGKLLLFVPYENQRRFRKYIPNEYNHHLYAWNVQTLAALVAKCGYKIESAQLVPFGYERFAANIIVKYSLPKWSYRLMLFLMRLIRPEREIFIVATRHEV